MPRNSVLLALLALALSATAAPTRSAAERAAFMRENPCPATGQRRGACPGYEVDHIQALVCGGPDTRDNMQWLSSAAHREKTRYDVRYCRKR